MMEFTTLQYGSIEVCTHEDLDGGGTTFGQDFLPTISKHIGKVGRVFEFCSGPGYIGFSLLAHGLCDSLCLADINPVATAACQETIERNQLGDQVSVYLSDCFDSIPATERWDLVVANPPGVSTSQLYPQWGEAIIYQDLEWKLRRRFYDGVVRYLNAGAILLFAECTLFSASEDFEAMIAGGGLRVVRSLPCGLDPRVYYVWSELAASGRVAP
jgi:methylase of polypeptide subunit release factors